MVFERNEKRGMRPLERELERTEEFFASGANESLNK